MPQVSGTGSESRRETLAGRSSSCTAAARTSSISSRFSESWTRSARLVGILPRGPLTLPPGGAHWYVVRQVGYPDPDTFFPTFARTSTWLDALLEELGVPPERTVLGGFSQGAVMSYALGLAASRPKPAAILAMSGFIPRVDGLRARSRRPEPVSRSRSRTGRTDPVIGVQWGRDARDRLTAAGLDVRYHEDPVDHTITPQAIAQAREVLEAALQPV